MANNPPPRPTAHNSDSASESSRTPDGDDRRRSSGINQPSPSSSSSREQRRNGNNVRSVRNRVENTPTSADGSDEADDQQEEEEESAATPWPMQRGHNDQQQDEEGDSTMSDPDSWEVGKKSGSSSEGSFPYRDPTGEYYLGLFDDGSAEYDINTPRRRSSVDPLSGYGPNSPLSPQSDQAAIHSPRSPESDDTVNGPPPSPLVGPFNPAAPRDLLAGGLYPMTIGRWINPANHAGVLDRQNLVQPRIDSLGRIAFAIQPVNELGQAIALPQAFGSNNRMTRATERQLQARLPAPQAAAHGYFEFLPRYAAVQNARNFILQDLAAGVWAQRQQEQIQDNAVREAVRPPPPPPPPREEWLAAHARDVRRVIRQAERREGRAGVRRARRRLARRWRRRALRAGIGALRGL